MPFFTPKPVTTDYSKEYALDLPRLLTKSGFTVDHWQTALAAALAACRRKTPRH
ncbi:MAG TPA: hypothetical protein QF509_03200 [Rhodospirillales bacterium]|jgi:uncharacterized protein YebE (UPF0316 family)|nr:hypothetical protein [Rhodospirillales bacterium]